MTGGELRRGSELDSTLVALFNEVIGASVAWGRGDSNPHARGEHMILSLVSTYFLLFWLKVGTIAAFSHALLLTLRSIHCMVFFYVAANPTVNK